MAAIDLNDERFPLVVVTFRGEASDAEFESYLSRLERCYRRREKLALVMDATNGPMLGAARRKQQADWLKDNAMVIHALNVGTAFVMSSALLRGALTAVLWLQPLPCPHDTFERTPDAIRWATAQLARHGITLPAERSFG